MVLLSREVREDWKQSAHEYSKMASKSFWCSPFFLAKPIMHCVPDCELKLLMLVSGKNFSSREDAHAPTKYQSNSTSGRGARASYRTMLPEISTRRSLLEPSFRYPSPGREGEKCRPLDHIWQIPFIHLTRFINSSNFYIYNSAFYLLSPCGTT